MDDCTDKSTNEFEKKYLSRALAAYSITSTTNLNEKDITKYITDGYNDNGIDALYFDETKQVLYLVQSKWHHDGRGTLEKGDALKFIKGVKDLFEEKYDKFNDRINCFASCLSNVIRSVQTKIVLIICHTGSQNISADIRHDFDDFLDEVNDPSEILKLIEFNQQDIHKSIAFNTSVIEINESIGLSNWGIINEPYKSFYGIISAEEIANWYKKYGSFLFAPNIRLFLGSTDVNEELKKTIISSPSHFVYFNNGITVLCDKIEKSPLGGSKREYGIFDCNHIAIINGAQTVGTIGEEFDKHPENVKSMSVFIKLISLEGTQGGFGTSVTKATNMQNRIDSRDFVSQDEENERLKRELLIDGIIYSYKRGENIDEKDKGFLFEEGIVALACENGNINYAIIAKRYVSFLWNDLSKAPYTALINKSLTGIKYWRIVQIFRKMELLISEKRGKYHGKKGMYLIHGNRIIEYLLFKKIYTLTNDDKFIDFPIENIYKIIEEHFEKIIDCLYETTEIEYPDSMLAFLFKNLKKCTRITEEVIRKLQNVS
jgi:hypothetical protein